MKKNKILLISLLVLPLLIGCGKSGDNSKSKDDTNQDVYFYLDYSHSDEPIYHMRWYREVPLGECPKEAVLTDEDAADPVYGKFIGYSQFSSSLDEDHIWDFKNDSKKTRTLKLYGIWVSEE